ncbi:MAG TPA: MFS transporter [Chitinophagaceae bacterium]|nr:MFS transporter [Chitinophagaceae bacterium]
MTTTTDQQHHDTFASIKIPEFKYLLLGRFTFTMGLRMMSTLVGWWIFQLTNLPFAIGIVGLSEFLPAFTLALYAGHVIDLSEKRWMLQRGMLLYCTCTLLLLLLSTHYSQGHFTHHTMALCIYGIIFCTGVTRAFTGPVFNVMLASIVPKKALQNATTWNTGSYLAASVCGHATGGFLIYYLGITGTLTTIAAFIFVAFLFISQLNKKPPLNLRGEKRTLESVKEGLRFVFKTKELLGAISLDLFAVLFGGAVAMVPVYITTILHADVRLLGWLNGASDLGSILVVVWLTMFPPRRRQGKKLLIVVAGFGVCIIIFGLSKIFLLSFFALMVSGMLDGFSVVIRGTITQLKTPDNMRGRVISVNSMFINSSNELGQFESGLAAKLLGVVPSVVFGGCMTLLVVIITWFKAPALREMEY